MSASTDSGTALSARLVTARRKHHLVPGARERCEQAARDVLALLFPHFAPPVAGVPSCEPETIADEVAAVRAELRLALGCLPGLAERGHGEVEGIVAQFIDRLPALFDALLVDARALLDWDPAAKSIDEVLLSYPGFRAVAFYRVGHELHLLGVPLAPRLISELAHRETGVDIHPGAQIGTAFAIDHGTGVVIGETTVIGDRVKLYQGVTLGAASVRKDLADRKRHPTVGSDVVIYASATILGGDTVIGDGSIIGGNVWLMHSVPPGSVVTHDGLATRVRSANGEEEPALEFHL